jgi:hypothetical protein
VSYLQFRVLPPLARSRGSPSSAGPRRPSPSSRGPSSSGTGRCSAPQTSLASGAPKSPRRQIGTRSPRGSGAGCSGPSSPAPPPASASQRPLVLADVPVVLLLNKLDEVLHDALVEVLNSQMRVAVH